MVNQATSTDGGPHAGRQGVRKPELLMPAGSLSKLEFALAYGADAVYVGAAGFSMRPGRASMTVEQLTEAVARAHGRGKRLYVAVNMLAFDDDIPQLEAWLRQTRRLSFDAMIVSDPGVLHWVRTCRPEMPIHISTQMSTTNSAAAAFWGAAGASRVILARECSIADAQKIAAQSGVEVEVFVHGAMCVAISGRCLLSAHLSGRSASRGDCKQSCRWEWQLVEQKRPGETVPIFEADGQTILMGSTDLCLIRRIPELMKSGVSCFKVEGRMKSEHYLAAVTRVYRAAIDLYARDPGGYVLNPSWVSELEAVSHRPYSEGFADGVGQDRGADLQTFNRSIATHDAVGYVHSATATDCLVEVKQPLKQGDTVEWIASDMRGGDVTVADIKNDAGMSCGRAVSGAQMWVRLENHPPLEPYSILRRPRIVASSAA